ncbi:MAG: hypothetical protein Q9221_001402 [Calogaya cf. arnoldii]
MVIDAKKFPEKPRDKPTVDPTIVTPWQVEDPPKYKPLSRVTDDGLGAVVQAALRLDLPEIAEAAVGFVKSSLPSALFGEIARHLAKEGSTAAWPRWLPGAMFRSIRSAERAKALDCFIDAYREADKAAIIQDVRLDLAILLAQPPRKRVKETFSEVADHRKHMEKQLRRSACKTYTLKEGRPYKLVVEKTAEEKQEALKGWRDRCETAYKAIEAVGFEKIRGILGEEWEVIVGFGQLRTALDGNSTRRPLGDLAQGKAPTATNSSKARKREGMMLST